MRADLGVAVPFLLQCVMSFWAYNADAAGTAPDNPTSENALNAVQAGAHTRPRVSST
jgi:hypothetical protein